MKIYEWNFQGRKGTITASNTKDAKEQLVGILRKKSDKSTRVPKGATLKKIGLTKGKAAVEATEEPKKSVTAEQKAATVHEAKFETLTKDTKFSDCVVYVKDVGHHFVSDKAELILSKGTECYKVVSW